MNPVAGTLRHYGVHLPSFFVISMVDRLRSSSSSFTVNFFERLGSVETLGRSVTWRRHQSIGSKSEFGHEDVRVKDLIL